MTPRLTMYLLAAELHWLRLELERGNDLQPYDLHTALERVGGNVEAWLQNPDEIRHQEVIDVENAIEERTPVVLEPSAEVGQRPFVGAGEVGVFDEELDHVPEAPMRALVEHKVMAAGRLIRNSDLPDEDRRRVARQMTERFYQSAGLGSPDEDAADMIVDEVTADMIADDARGDDVDEEH